MSCCCSVCAFVVLWVEYHRREDSAVFIYKTCTCAALWSYILAPVYLTVSAAGEFSPLWIQIRHRHESVLRAGVQVKHTMRRSKAYRPCPILKTAANASNAPHWPQDARV